MTLLHDARHTGPDVSPPRARGVLLVVLGVVALLAVVVATVSLALRGRGDNDTASNTIRGSGIASAQTRAVPPFTAVELAGSNTVVVQVGSPRSVVVHADNNLINHVHTAVRAGVLLIWDRGSFSTRAPMRVTVVTPTLTRVSLTGSGTVTVDGVDSPAFAASLPGSGTVYASGRTGHLEASLPGSGRLDLQQLIARVAGVQLAGSGEVRVQATGSVDAAVSGSGAVLYAGNPASVTKTITGTGAVEAG
jgi:Putative auto-transporter adhesin, head GIN domain